jgi:hypothetical protein
VTGMERFSWPEKAVPQIGSCEAGIREGGIMKYQLLVLKCRRSIQGGKDGQVGAVEKSSVKRVCGDKAFSWPAETDSLLCAVWTPEA